MNERIVVTFWMPHTGLAPEQGRRFLERARTLTQRAEAAGATLVAFGSQMCAFAIDPDLVEEAIGLSAAISEEKQAGEVAWACGVAEGPIEPFSPSDMRGGLAWGPALATAAALARVAEPGEVLLDDSFKGTSALVVLGRRVRRDGWRRVRGAILDTKQPWRAVAAMNVSRMAPVQVAGANSSPPSSSPPPLFGREDPSGLLWVPGALAILRADPGLGGTRILQELARMVEPAPSLYVAPTGAGLEPLGALRRALVRARVADAPHLEPELGPALHRLLAGDGVRIETAAAIVASFLRPVEGRISAGALLIDDATDVDGATLEACAGALVSGDKSFPCVARLDATSSPPPALSVLPRGSDMELKPLGTTDAEALAAALVGGAMDAETRRRWARRGAATPLGIFEAIAESLTSGELGWQPDGVVPHRRSRGRGRPLPARDWIVRRARLLASPVDQLILAIVALLGGEARVSRVENVLAHASVAEGADEAMRRLLAQRWLVESELGWVALPTRTHREAIATILTDESLRAVIHGAIARTLEQEERGLGLAEVAHHRALAGDGPRAARVALEVARAAWLLDLQQGATRLVALAREHDPSVDAEARAQLASAIPRGTVRGGLSPDASNGVTLRGAGPEDDGGEVTVSAPTVLLAEREAELEMDVPTNPDAERPAAIAGAPPGGAGFEPGAHVPAAAHGADAPKGAATEPRFDAEPATSRSVGERLTELAKEALLDADTRALERWTEGLVATGEHGRFAERMNAIAHLSRGEVGEALRVLRMARAQASACAAEKCQAALALGVGLAVAGRSEEALLEALHALARAREAKDEKGAFACLAFLAKLYATSGRSADAERLHRFARLSPDLVHPPARG